MHMYVQEPSGDLVRGEFPSTITTKQLAEEANARELDGDVGRAWAQWLDASAHGKAVNLRDTWIDQYV